VKEDEMDRPLECIREKRKSYILSHLEEPGIDSWVILKLNLDPSVSLGPWVDYTESGNKTSLLTVLTSMRQ
jgi:hypothetical protein